MPSTDRLVKRLVAAGIRDRRVLDAFRAVPRDAFVPEHWREQSHQDTPLPLPHQQVTTQPSLIAKMVEALALRGGERVLEIGTGYGFQTALLASLAGEVWSVERWADMASDAAANLARQGIENAHVALGDGSQGFPEHAPFEAIVVAAAHPDVPAPLAGQLASGGRLVQPLGPGGQEQVTLFLEEGGRLRQHALLTSAHFVRLVGAHGFQADQ